MAAKTYPKTKLAISLVLIVLAFSTTAHAATTADVPNSYFVVEDNIEYYMQTDKEAYDVRENVQMMYRVTNLGDEDVEFRFSYGPIDNTCDWMVDKDGLRIWDNLGRPGTGVMTYLGLAPSQSYEYTNTWDTTDNDGDDISPGNYTVTGVLGYPSFNERYVPVSVSIDIILEPKTYYVHPGESIQERIDDPNVLDGDTIIVYPGTYTGDGNRDIDFNGKAITVRSIDPNDPKNVAATIIDCDGMEAEPHRGFYFHSNEDASSVLAGLTITNGYAANGGGVYCKDSSPTVTNCTFSRNTGGSYYGGGGGMYNLRSHPTLTDCIFSDNSIKRPTDWWIDTKGGGIYNDKSNPTLTNCVFTGNSVVAINGFGGGMANEESSPMLSNCIFTGNSVGNSGGGMRNEYSSPVLLNCTFSGNLVGGWGGGISNSYSNPMLTNCTFRANSAEWFGGGISNYHSNPTVTKCTFNRNFAQDGGAGMFNQYGSQATVKHCTFTGNSAGYWGGGGVNNYRSNPRLENCTFSFNSVTDYGGALKNGQSSPTVTNCTFSGNSASTGRAMFNQSYSSPAVTNCILWDEGDEIENDPGSSVMAKFSDIKGGWPGEGNIDSDPLFVDPGYWDANGTPEDANDDFWIDGDYHLLPGSPCINAGDPNYIAEPNETDLEGNPRVINGRIDMGAYEYSPPISAEVRIVPRTINLQSKGTWIAAFIRLPVEYNVADIDPNSVFLEGQIKAEPFSVNEQQQVATAKFIREDVQTILEVGEIDLTITGRFMDGTPFEAKDSIRVINKSSRKSAN